MKNLVLLLMLSACSHLSQPPQVEGQEKLPVWVYSVYDFCTESSELCASGEGPNAYASDAEAKSNLASIFKVHITSNFKTSLTEQNTVHQLEKKVLSQATQELQSSVDEVLESVEVKQRFKQDNVFYSLATLDKDIAINILTKRMKRIDDQLKSYWKKQKKTLARRMLKLSAERAGIEEKLAVLTPVFEPAPVSYEQVLNWTLSPTRQGVIGVKVAQSPKWLTSKVSTLLNEVGYKTSENAHDVVTINVTSIKEFLNVEGFEKFTFTMKISHIRDNDKVGSLSKSETVVGRNQEDALLKIKKTFSEYLEEELYQLNLD